jgi:hypothetical protein
VVSPGRSYFKSQAGLVLAQYIHQVGWSLTLRNLWSGGFFRPTVSGCFDLGSELAG